MAKDARALLVLTRKFSRRRGIKNAPLLLLLLLSGCGGGGGGGPRNLSVSGSLSASSPLVDPDQAVQLTFSGQHVLTADNNFVGDMGPFMHGGSGVEGQLLDGTVNFHPTVTETFTFRLFGVWNDHLNLSTTVTVKPTNQRYLVVGDPNSPDLIPAINALQSLSTFPVEVQSTIPAPDGSVDAILIDQTGSVSPADVPNVRAYLAQGKGVIIVRAAPRLLATGNANDTSLNNIASIKSWFGGGPTLYTAFGNTHALPSSYVPVPITLIHSSRQGIGPLFEVGTLNPGGDPVAGNNAPFLGDPNNLFIVAFGYRPADGGRIYYQANTSFLDDPILLAAGARWAATGP